jgi:hypothetical protein
MSIRSNAALFVVLAVMVFTVVGCDRTNRVIAGSSTPANAPEYSEEMRTTERHPALDTKGM